MGERTLSVKDVCERFAVGEHTVLRWIRQGELRAVNCGRSLASKKPRWRVTVEALAAFEQFARPPRRCPKPAAVRRPPYTGSTNAQDPGAIDERQRSCGTPACQAEGRRLEAPRPGYHEQRCREEGRPSFGR